jgi:formylglycine-generating enzyme
MGLARGTPIRVYACYDDIAFSSRAFNIHARTLPALGEYETSRALMRFFPSPPLSVVLVAIAGCSSTEPREAPGSTASALAASAPGGAATGSAPAPPAVAADGGADASADPGDGGAAPPLSLPGRTDGCAEGMVRVEGEYCPGAAQRCVEHHKEYREHKSLKHVSERCMRYAPPSRCLSKKRQRLDFCMDRYEYPNKPGELPWVLTSWIEAKAICERDGKRLCTEPEFNFACEGPEMKPYVYGFTRDTSICNIDKPYRLPDHSRVLHPYHQCLDTPWCAAELQRLDQRHRIGELTSCVSWAGIFDLNGNVNEWVSFLKEKPPNRSGLKGGWWGPVRGRCRPTVTVHKEMDYGYEVGFRCCADKRG